MKKIASIAVIVVLMASMLLMAIPTSYAVPLEDNTQKWYDVDTTTRNWVMNEAVEPRTHHSYWNVGDAAIWSYYDDFFGGVVFTFFTLKYLDNNVEIWVQNNLNWGRPSAWTGTFPYGPEWRSNPPKGPTDLQMQYLAAEFGNNILPTESGFFSPPLFHDGSNAQADDLLGLPSDYYTEPTGRSVLLVCNIRDANYYLPNYGGPGVAYPYKIIGVHISEYEDVYYDRNCITIDAISWDRQLGPPGYTWPGAAGPVTAPYAYESTVAHEWQHLLHHEYAPGDATFMNEGCSMYAEFLCGYGIDPDYPNSYFATPDNSLTVWGDQGDINILADYGAAALWCMYLNDRFGSAFIQYYFQQGGGGIAGLNADLADFGTGETFDSVYHDWRLANLIRADFPGCHKYNYQSLDLNDPEYIPVRLYEVGGMPFTWQKGTDFGNTITILGYDTGVSRMESYGTDYISLENWTRIGFLYFNGDDKSYIAPPYLWTLTADGWYSGTGVDLANEAIAGDAYVNPSDPTLTIVTAYGFESYWDFGFVQVSTDGGKTWTSLENAYTTFDHASAAHPDIVANLPGLTDYNPDFPDWTTMSFDLSAYAGMTVKIGFRYMTDWATTYEGWWINSATVSGAALSLTPFSPAPPEVDFKVTVVEAIVICGKTFYLPYDMCLKDSTETGWTVGFAKKPLSLLLVVTPITEKGTVDYQFEVTRLPIPCKFLGDD